MMTPPAVVLAGGRASRMGGGDKGLLPFGAGCLLDAVLVRLLPQAGPVAINAGGDPARFARFGLPVLADPVPGQPGPLVGILAAMDWAAGLGALRVVTVPCDVPFLPADLIARLTESLAPGLAPDLAENSTASPITNLAPDDPARPAIAATAGGGIHPVVGLWPVALAPRLRDRLARGEHRVRALADAAGAVTVTFPPGPPDPFLNLNSPGELRAAEGWQ